MTKLLVWGVFIFYVAIIVHYSDVFSKKCTEAGGMPFLTLSHMICLNPAAQIELPKGEVK